MSNVAREKNNTSKIEEQPMPREIFAQDLRKGEVLPVGTIINCPNGVGDLEWLEGFMVYSLTKKNEDIGLHTLGADNITNHVRPPLGKLENCTVVVSGQNKPGLVRDIDLMHNPKFLTLGSDRELILSADIVSTGRGKIDELMLGVKYSRGQSRAYPDSKVTRAIKRIDGLETSRESIEELRDESRSVAYRLARLAILHPLNGGLPGLGSSRR